MAQGVECKSINPGIGVDHQMAHRKNGTDLRAVWLGRGQQLGNWGLGISPSSPGLTAALLRNRQSCSLGSGVQILNYRKRCGPEDGSHKGRERITSSVHSWVPRRWGIGALRISPGCCRCQQASLEAGITLDFGVECQLFSFYPVNLTQAMCPLSREAKVEQLCF